MEKGFLCIVLHTHLPYVRHPEYKDPLEEHWFYEAITETYIPLINMFTSLINDDIDFRITMTMSPTLSYMFTDELLQNRYVTRIEKLIELAEKEVARTSKDIQFNKTAQMYLDKFKECRRTFVDVYNKNILTAFKQFQELGKIEIITCSATHCFLPAFELYPNNIRAQVAVGYNEYIRNFQKHPKGMWSGECGYFPGLDNYFAKQGLRYFFVDTHGILNADYRPRYGIYAPLYCPSGVAVFGRDPESSKSVWSAQEGYPGNPDYREFYRDIGYDLDDEYIKPYIHESGLRTYTGIKYFKITGRTKIKKPYDRRRAIGRAAFDAEDFLSNRIQQVKTLNTIMDRPPIAVAPYDSELFGHWWFEGPDWLNFLIRKIYKEQDTIELITPTEYLNKFPDNQVATPSFSSWGFDGYASVWVEGSNDWIYPPLHKNIEKMINLSNIFKNAEGIVLRTLNQCAREILLAQASDWPFIIKTNTMVDYAKNRINAHLQRFSNLYTMIKDNSIDENYLDEIEKADNIFYDINYKIFSDV